MESWRKMINVRLINNAKDYKKYISKPNFDYQKYLVKILLLFMRLNLL